MYPLLLVCVTVAGYRWAAATANLRPLVAAVLANGCLQLAGQGIFALNYARHVLSGESRDAFLSRNVSGYAPVPWINANLGPSDRVLLFARQLNYLIDVPIFYADFTLDVRINVLPSAGDPGRFFHQLRDQDVTHLLVNPGQSGKQPARGTQLWRALVTAGCAKPVRDFETRVIVSRTLAAADRAESRVRLIKLTGAACPG